MKIKQMVQTMAIAGTLGVAAHAELINVQFGCTLTSGCLGGVQTHQYAGAAVVGSTGDYWNLVDGNTSGPGLGANGAAAPGETLLNSASGAAGLAGNAKVTWTADNMYNSTATNSAFGIASYANQANLANLMDSYLTNENGSRMVSFSGLKTNTQYQLIAIAQGNGPIGDHVRVVGFSAVGGSGSTANASLVAGTTTNTFIQNNNYSILNVNSGSTGSIVLTWTKTTADEADLNGIQLSDVTATPEPSSIWLGIGGMATMLGLQRRRRNA